MSPAQTRLRTALSSSSRTCRTIVCPTVPVFAAGAGGKLTFAVGPVCYRVSNDPLPRGRWLPSDGSRLSLWLRCLIETDLRFRACGRVCRGMMRRGRTDFSGQPEPNVRTTLNSATFRLKQRRSKALAHRSIYLAASLQGWARMLTAPPQVMRVHTPRAVRHSAADHVAVLC